MSEQRKKNGIYSKATVSSGFKHEHANLHLVLGLRCRRKMLYKAKISLIVIQIKDDKIIVSVIIG